MNKTATRNTIAMLLGLGFLGLTAGRAMSGPPPAAKPAPPAAAAPATAKPAPAADGAIPQINTESMTPSERDAFKRLLEKFPSACGKSHSLITSLRTDPKCSKSVIAARWMAKLFSDGFLESEVDEKYSKRFVAAKCYQIDTAGAQVKGDPNAPITIVEFADFECPHCAMADPILSQVLKQYKNVKLVFMNYPIAMHPNAANSAAAALAAGKQGKFWEFHDKLFKHQDRQRPTDLIMYAEEMKLDVKRFQADTEALRSRVKRERDIGETLDLTGTPSLFINCHKVEGSPTLELLSSYIDAELAQ